MKRMILLLTMLLTFSVFSQIEYPIMEKDSLGNTVVIFSLEQAQDIDNKLELLELLEKMDGQILDYDSLCVKVVNEKDEVIAKQDIQIKKMTKLLDNKDDQVLNLKSQIIDYQAKEETYKKQLKNKDKEIKLHKDKISDQRNKMILGGSIGGAIIAGLVYLIIAK